MPFVREGIRDGRILRHRAVALQIPDRTDGIGGSRLSTGVD